DRIRPEASAAQFLRRPAAILRSLAARERSRTGSAPTGHTACARRPPPRLWEGLQPRCGKLAAEAAPTEAGLQPLELARGDHHLASVRLWEGLQPRCGRLAAEAAPTEVAATAPAACARRPPPRFSSLVGGALAPMRKARG